MSREDQQAQANESESRILAENVDRGKVVAGLVNQARSLRLFFPPPHSPFLSPIVLDNGVVSAVAGVKECAEHSVAV